MKHFTLLLSMCIVAIVNAQTEKGNFLMGGSGSLQRVSQDNSTSTSFSLSPGISYFVADRFALGIITPFSTSNGTTTGPNAGTSYSTSYAIGPTIRYYFPLSTKVAIFPQLDYYHNWQTFHLDLSGLGVTEFKSNVNTYRFNAGITYFIARNVGIEGILYYQNGNGDTSITLSDSGSTFGIRLGFQIYLLRGKEESK